MFVCFSKKYGWITSKETPICLQFWSLNVLVFLLGMLLVFVTTFQLKQEHLSRKKLKKEKHVGHLTGGYRHLRQVNVADLKRTWPLKWPPWRNQSQSGRGYKCATLTSFVHNKVSGTELVAVEVLDGDEVVGSDAPLQSPVLPHHVRCGFGEHHLHCNPEQEKKKGRSEMVHGSGAS